MNSLLKRTAAYLLTLLAAGHTYAQAPANLWSKGYGGTRGDILNAFVPQPGGGAIAVGTTSSDNGDISGKTTGSTDNDWWIVRFNDTGAITRQRVIGSTGSDYLYAIRPLRKGGYIAAGFISGNTRDFATLTVRAGMDAAIVKFNDTLGIDWVKIYGGSGSESFYDISEAPDGSLAVCGYTNSTDGDITHKMNGTTDDWWIMTTDSAGNIRSNKTYGGSGPTSLLYQERAYAIRIDPANNIVVSGTSSSNDGTLTGKGLGQNDMWMLQLNDTLGINWQKTLGGANADISANIIIDTDSNYVLAGNTKSTDGYIINPKGGGQTDVWLAKLSKVSGDTIWTRSYGGTKADATNGYRAIRPTKDGGYIIAASSVSTDLDVSSHYGGSTNAYNDCWIIKLNNNGNIQWEKNLGSTGIDNPNEIQQLQDGSYLFIGQSSGSGGDVGTNKGSTDIFITKIAPCPAYTYITATTCEGHPYLFNGQPLYTAGTYFDTLSMASGCDSIIRLTLTINPSVITELTDTICKGNSYTFNSRILTNAGTYIDTFAQALTACDSLVKLTLVVDSVIKPIITVTGDTLTTGNYASYQWIDAATGNNIPGANARTYTAPGTGSYRIAVTGENGCTDTSDTYNHIGTGITDPILNSIKIYPNPVTENLNMLIPETAGNTTLTIHAMDGVTILERNLQKGTHTIPVQTLSPGIYTIRITNQQGAVTRRIVKQ